MAETLRLAHLSDAHTPLHQRLATRELFGKRALSGLNWARTRRRVHVEDILGRVVADIRAHAPDHVAMTGDAVNFGLPREFEGAADWLSGFGAPEDVSFVPGNHEAIHPGVEAAREAAFAPYMTGDDGRAGAPYLRVRGPAALIGVSSCISTAPFFAQGEVGAEQRRAVAARLAEAEGRARVILIHHPPSGRSKRRKHLRDAAAFRAMAAEAGAELVLHGHNHRAELSWIDAPDRRIPVLGVPSASASGAFGDELAEWRLFEIARDGARWRLSMRRRALAADGAMVGLGRFDFAL